MSTQDKMTIDERRKYLCRMKARYVKANRMQGARLLNEIEAAGELRRKV